MNNFILTLYRIILLFVLFAPIWYCLVRIYTKKLTSNLTRESLIHNIKIAGISTIIFYGVIFLIFIAPGGKENGLANALFTTLWCLLVTIFYVFLLIKETITLIINLFKFKNFKTLFLIIPILLLISCMIYYFCVQMT